LLYILFLSLGPRLPDLRKLSTSQYLRTTYAKIALALFCPYRRFDDLLQKPGAPVGELFNNTEDDSKWWHAWEARKAWVREHPLINSIMNHMQDYHDGVSHATLIRGVPSRDGDDLAQDYMRSRAPRQQEQREAFYSDFELSEDLTEPEHAAAADTLFVAHRNAQWQQAAEALRPTQPVSTTQAAHWPSYCNTTTYSGPVSGATVRSWVRPTVVPQASAATSASETSTATQADLQHDDVNAGLFEPCGPSTTTTYAGDAQWTSYERTEFPPADRKKAAPTIESAATSTLNSIAEISAAFQHDAQQYRAFVTAATSFVQTILTCRQNATAHASERVELPPQLLLNVPGPAGAGKSAVILALKFLAARMQVPQTILTTSISSAAALSVDGITFDSFISASSFGALTATKLTAARLKYDKIQMFILDEISFVTHPHLYTLDLHMQQIFACDKPFGGKHVIIAGDFLQVFQKCAAP